MRPKNKGNVSGRFYDEMLGLARDKGINQHDHLPVC
jgi:hypothetical protein